MTYKIKRRTDGVTIETHDKLRAAEHAFWVLTAHELKNGRLAGCYQLFDDHVERTSLPSPSEFALQSWAVEELRKAGFV